MWRSLSVMLCGFFLLGPKVASAQTASTAVSRDSRFLIQITSPTAADGGLVDCAYPQAGCVPFNRAMCDRAMPFKMVVTRGNGYPLPATPPAPNTLPAMAWLQKGSGACTNNVVASDPNVSPLRSLPISLPATTTASVTTRLLPGSSALLYGNGTAGLIIPDDFGGTGLTTQALLQAFPEICDPAEGVGFSYYRICFGISLNNSTVIGAPTNTGTAADIVGYWQFPVKTKPPPAPGPITTRSLVSRVELTVRYEAEYPYAIRTMWTSDANLQSVPDCGQWATLGKVDGEITAPVSENGQSVNFMVPGKNGVPYAYCSQIVDLLGNAGPYSEPAYDSPHPECNYFDCYPGELTVGFCGAGLSPVWAAVFTAGYAARKALRRRRRRL